MAPAGFADGSAKATAPRDRDVSMTDLANYVFSIWPIWPPR
jgi:hypothetical protein